MLDFIIVFAIMVVIAIFTSIVTVKSRKPGAKFDERQLIGRGKAAAAGFYTLMLVLGCYIFYDAFVTDSLLTPAIGIGLCIIVSAAAFAMVGIIKDAFVERSGTLKSRITLFIVLGAANIAMGVPAVIDGTLMENGKLGIATLNLAVGVTAVIVVVSLSIKAAMQKKATALEESDDE